MGSEGWDLRDGMGHRVSYYMLYIIKQRIPCKYEVETVREYYQQRSGKLWARKHHKGEPNLKTTYALTKMSLIKYVQFSTETQNDKGIFVYLFEDDTVGITISAPCKRLS